MSKHTEKSWCTASTSNHQGFVIDENTGDNIAVVYDKANVPLIAVAPKLLAACKLLVIFADEILPQAGRLCFDVRNLNDALCTARPAIASAEETK